MIKKKISNQFLINYIIMMVITILIIILIIILISFADSAINQNLVCNNIVIEDLMKDNIEEIESDKVLENGGGIQIVNKEYKVIYSKGIDTLGEKSLTPQEFTDFLTSSKSNEVEYCYNILYNESQEFWLIVTFPTSIKINFSIIHNKTHPSKDGEIIFDILVTIGILFFLLLAITTIIYSKISSFGIIVPLRKLCEGTNGLRNGEYSTRVNLGLKNEFGELESTFNNMADKIQKEILLREASEKMRQKQLMYISHDLKNPLVSIIGYAELCLNKKNITLEEQRGYIDIIKHNGIRSNRLIENIFELTKLESSDFALKVEKIDFAEYLRVLMANYILDLEKNGFAFNFNIPDDEVYVMIDKNEFDRVFQNLISNAIKYNKVGTNINVELINNKDNICIIVEDNGIGIPKDMVLNIFNEFVRVDDHRNSETGGSGLGLVIIKKIINAHGGEISLKSDVNSGCSFKINLPKI